MDINLLFKIAGIGILVAVLYQVLVKAGREDQAMMTTLARSNYCFNNCYKRNSKFI
jgi:stage III sporulation protein AC